jgi:hypothetical protein
MGCTGVAAAGVDAVGTMWERIRQPRPAYPRPLPLSLSSGTGSEGSEGRAIEVGPSRFGTCVCALGPVNCPRPNLFAPNCYLELKLTFFPCSPRPSMLRPARCLSRLYCLHAPLRSSHDGASFCPFSCQHLVKPAAARNRMCVRDPAPERGG